MTSMELKLGDRVRLNELGVSRSPRIKVRRGVVAVPLNPRSRAACIQVLFDGNRRPTSIHCSYLERDRDGG